MGKNGSPENWVFLRGVAGDAEAGVVESLLRAYQIPVLRKYRRPVIFQGLYGDDRFGNRSLCSRRLPGAGRIAAVRAAG